MSVHVYPVFLNVFHKIESGDMKEKTERKKFCLLKSRGLPDDNTIC